MSKIGPGWPNVHMTGNPTSRSTSSVVTTNTESSSRTVGHSGSAHGLITAANCGSAVHRISGLNPVDGRVNAA